MRNLINTLMSIIAELPDHPPVQAMPQTHYLNGERGFMDEVTLLLPRGSEKAAGQPPIDDPVISILPSQPLQNLR